MGHWYDKEGAPRHHEGKDGKATTLREARKYSLYPSVTTIGQIVSKFQLTNWLQEEAAMMAVEMAAEQMDASGCCLCASDFEREWAKTVVKASRDKTMAKADAGTDIHAILEKHLNGIRVADEHQPMCIAVVDLINEKCGEGIGWLTEERFCDTEHGYAGMCDLHDENGAWVIDFKTKDTVDKRTRGWPEQAEQLAAYAHGLGSPNARLANIFISREDPTQCVWHEHKDPMAWERFRHALMLWQVSKKFGPYYEKMIAT